MNRSEKLCRALLLAVIYPFALLPLGVLYVLSDLLFYIIYYIVRYRRGLVERNLAACFPEKTHEERSRITREFYRNFTDYVVETVKLLHISDAEMQRRFKFENLELIQRHVAEGRSVVVYFSHCFNWEWAPSVTLNLPGDKSTAFCQIYRPLRNRAFDSVMLRVRNRFGSHSLPKSSALRDLIRFRREGIVTVTGFMSDQKPSHGDPTVPLMFLNQPTAFISGTETLARKMGMAAVYWDMHRLGRGKYKIVTRPIADNVADEPEHRPTPLRLLA